MPVIVFLLVLIAVFLGSLLSGALYWLLWNLVVEDMFNGPNLHYWVAVLFAFVLNGLLANNYTGS